MPVTFLWASRLCSVLIWVVSVLSGLKITCWPPDGGEPLELVLINRSFVFSLMIECSDATSIKWYSCVPAFPKCSHHVVIYIASLSEPIHYLKKKQTSLHLCGKIKKKVSGLIITFLHSFPRFIYFSQLWTPHLHDFSLTHLFPLSFSAWR